MQALVTVLLATFSIAYGLFYHISSSEFWPITMSKSLWTFNAIETSFWQKPLFNFFLALIHLIPNLTDVQHLQLVKALFAVFGYLGVLFFISSLRYLAGDKRHHLVFIDYIMTFIVMICSPILLNNFFRIRSDQFTFFISSLALFLVLVKSKKWALILWILAFFVSLKSLIIVLPFMLLAYYEKISLREVLGLRYKWYFFFSLLALILWFAALNIHSLGYLMAALENPISLVYLENYFLSEFPLILLSFCTLVFILKDTERKKLIYLFTLGFIFLLISPQALSFYIASLVLFIYAPIIIFLQKLFISFETTSLNKRLILVTCLISLIGYHVFNISIHRTPTLRTHLQQLEYIESTSTFLNRTKLTYLDGVGLFPRQINLSCFYSPEDEESNENCWSQIESHQADIYILTGRLASFGRDLEAVIKSDYTLIKPNTWIKNDQKYRISENEDQPEYGPAPILIFGF